MKKILYTLLLATPLSVLSGCNKIDDETFDRSSSERVQAMIDSAFETLTSSDEGWYFNYYQGWTADAELGGFWFLCKFNDDYTVEAASEIGIPGYPAGKVAKSDFGLIRGRGAVLTFNTYNSILHFLAEPSVSMPDGYEGDYEFTIVSVTEDVVTVKGIKSGKTMSLYRKKDGKTVEKAMTDLAAASENIYFAPSFNAGIDGASSSGMVSRTGRKLSLTYTAGEETATVDMIGSTSLDGKTIILYEPVVVNGKTITGFTLDGKNRLVSDDAAGSLVLTLPTIPQMLSSSSLRLPNDETNMGSELLSSVSTAAAINTLMYGETFLDMAIGRGINSGGTAYTGTPALIFRSDAGTNIWAVHYSLDFTPVAGTTDQVAVKYTGPVLNASYYTWFETVVKLIDAKSPYKLTSDNPDYPNDPTSPTVIKFVSKADPSFFFTAYF